MPKHKLTTKAIDANKTYVIEYAGDQPINISNLAEVRLTKNWSGVATVFLIVAVGLVICPIIGIGTTDLEFFIGAAALSLVVSISSGIAQKKVTEKAWNVAYEAADKEVDRRLAAISGKAPAMINNQLSQLSQSTQEIELPDGRKIRGSVISGLQLQEKALPETPSQISPANGGDHASNTTRPSPV